MGVSESSSERQRWPETARLVVAILAVALAAGGFAILFRSSLSWLYRTVFHADNVVEAIARLPAWLTVIALGLGGLGAGLLHERMRARQGVGNVMEAVALGRINLSLAATCWRAAGSWIAIACGLSIGREGPLIEFGGSMGAAIARRLDMPLNRLRALVAAGTAAGFGAAYNTPFAAILFVLETLIGIAALDALLPTIIAAVLATSLTREIAGAGPIYGNRLFSLASPVELALHAALGVIAVAAAEGFKRTLAVAETVVARLPLRRPWITLLGGLAVGVIAAAIPLVAGNGYEALNLVLDGRLAVTALTILLVAKIVATSTSVASGVPGGVFTPVLLIGGIVGTLWGHALAALGGTTPQTIGSFALVGMAATTGATTHAPLTAAIMVFELSGDYPIALPLLLATSLATACSRVIGGESVYTAELRRHGVTWEVTLDGRRIER